MVTNIVVTGYHRVALQSKKWYIANDYSFHLRGNFNDFADIDVNKCKLNLVNNTIIKIMDKGITKFAISLNGIK